MKQEIVYLKKVGMLMKSSLVPDDIQARYKEISEQIKSGTFIQS